MIHNTNQVTFQLYTYMNTRTQHYILVLVFCLLDCLFHCQSSIVTLVLFVYMCMCVDLWNVKGVSRYVASSAFRCSFLVNRKSSCVSSLSAAAVVFSSCEPCLSTYTHIHKYLVYLALLFYLLCAYFLSNLLKPLFLHLSTFSFLFNPPLPLLSPCSTSPFSPPFSH